MAIEVEAVKAITQIQNGAIFFAAVVAWGWTSYRLRMHYRTAHYDYAVYDPRVVQTLWALWAISLAVMIRIGYWLPSIYFATAGEHYANWSEPIKPIVYLPASILFVSGVTRLIGVLGPKPRRWCWRMYAGSILFGVLLAIGGVVW